MPKRQNGFHQQSRHLHAVNPQGANSVYPSFPFFFFVRFFFPLSPLLMGTLAARLSCLKFLPNPSGRYTSSLSTQASVQSSPTMGATFGTPYTSFLKCFLLRPVRHVSSPSRVASPLLLLSCQPTDADVPFQENCTGNRITEASPRPCPPIQRSRAGLFQQPSRLKWNTEKNSISDTTSNGFLTLRIER